MKAWFLHQINDLRFEQTDTPALSHQEVLVEVKAAGICGSDIPRIYRTGTYSYPLIPGHEFSGVVAELGKGVDSSWQNQRVGIFPLIPCRCCGPCRDSQYEMCRSYSYLGSRRNGGFAQYVAVPVWNLIRLPGPVSFEEAAMLEPMAVAAHALRRMRPSPSHTVTICGLGTIGLLLLMFLKEAGIQNILVIGNKDSQKRMVLQSGIPEDHYCDSKKQDAGSWIMERTDGRGTDLFFECVGKNETCAAAVQNTAPAGRILLVGNPCSSMHLEKDVYWKILRNQLTVAGTWNSSFTHSQEDDWNYVLKRLEKRKTAPSQLITHRLSLDELEQGLKIMHGKTEDYIKIMIHVSAD